MGLLFAFRTDASLNIGTGHVMRCLTLADGLRDRGARCLFVSRELDGHLCDWIERRGFEVRRLPMPGKAGLTSGPPEGTLPSHSHWLGTSLAQDAAETLQALQDLEPEWLVVDHYALDRRWESALRVKARRIFVIDDLADRPHDCDLLLDQNLGRFAADYADLVHSEATLQIGPTFALLRPEFAHWRARSLERRHQPRFQRLLISLGGVDQLNVTGAVLQSLQHSPLPPSAAITVVMGQRAPWLSDIEERSKAMHWPTQVLCGVDNMAQIMTHSDLAIGAGGGTAWERCCLGLPTLVMSLAENQVQGAQALQAHGGARVLSDPNDLPHILQDFVHPDGSTDRMSSMSQAAAAMTDGLGVDRVVQTMLNTHV